MSDQTKHPAPPEESEPTPEEAVPEIPEGDLEDVSGGIIEGGCIPPFPWEITGPTY